KIFMAGTKEIKRRIKSVKNTKKITKAMELVAASKMKRALSSTLATRSYAGYSWEVLTSVARNIEENSHPLFTQREVKNVLLVLITSNRGLCGAYNAQAIKKAISLFKIEKANVDVVTVGKKGDVAMRRLGKKVLASFTELPDQVNLTDVLPVSKLIIDEYKSGRYDKVLVAYTDFISALNQKPNIKQVLPVSQIELKEFIDSLENIKPKEEKIEQKVNYLIEGDIEQLIGSLAEKISRIQIYQMILESNASEQSSRMVAMKNASDASGTMIEDLTLIFNKARQSNITREISEISAGMASVS
ncbi:ATP synthase F1 subunit gamma, partial [Patescibacteria group bacterium]|nr:ATP synthase F1 subunit gamma [Patescibacteria group bacterium]